MDVQDLSISSISVLKQSQIQEQVQVNIQKKAMGQVKIAGQLIQDAVASSPEPGKGERLNITA